MTDVVRPDQLLKHLRALEGERHHATSPERLKAAQQYLSDQWRSWGLAVHIESFSYLGEPSVNLIARPRHIPPGPRLIIGAHLDTVPGTPGADDNASGVAALLEVSRVLAATSKPLPLECVAFSLEELGMVGSARYASTLRTTNTELLGMLSLEMVGFTESEGLQHYPWFLRGRFPAVGNYIGLAANHRSRALLTTVARAMRTVKGLPVETLVLPANGWVFPESRLSDHAPFWDRGYPALLITDTSFFRNPHYHQPSDAVDTLDLEFLTKVTQGLLATVEQLTKF